MASKLKTLWFFYSFTPKTGMQILNLAANSLFYLHLYFYFLSHALLFFLSCSFLLFSFFLSLSRSLSIFFFFCFSVFFLLHSKRTNHHSSIHMFRSSSDPFVYGTSQGQAFPAISGWYRSFLVAAFAALISVGRRHLLLQCHLDIEAKFVWQCAACRESLRCPGCPLSPVRSNSRLNLCPRHSGAWGDASFMGLGNFHFPPILFRSDHIHSEAIFCNLGAVRFFPLEARQANYRGSAMGRQYGTCRFVPADPCCHRRVAFGQKIPLHAAFQYNILEASLSVEKRASMMTILFHKWSSRICANRMEGCLG